MGRVNRGKGWREGMEGEKGDGGEGGGEEGVFD